MLNMKISELVGRDVKVKLGAKDGSAFVYCGNLKDVDICDIDEAIRNAYQQSLQNAKDTIRLLKNKDLSYEAYEREMAKKYDHVKKRVDKSRWAEFEEKYRPTNLGFHHWTADINKRLEWAKTTRRRINAKLNNYTSIAERIIVDVYQSIDEADTLILLFDGTENGKAWTTNEYLNGIEEGESL